MCGGSLGMAGSARIRPLYIAVMRVSSLPLAAIFYLSAAYSATVAEDIHELERVTRWELSSSASLAPQIATPEQVCGIEQLDRYTIRRLDYEENKG
jgi:hypothetical protein